MAYVYILKSLHDGRFYIGSTVNLQQRLKHHFGGFTPSTKRMGQLEKDNSGKYYKGVTNDLERRLKEHRGGHTITTSRMNNLEVVYSEDFDNFKEAREREVYLKTAAGRRFLKKILARP